MASIKHIIWCGITKYVTCVHSRIIEWMRKIYEVFQFISFLLKFLRNSSGKNKADLSYRYLWYLLNILNQCGINEVRQICSFYYTSQVFHIPCLMITLLFEKALDEYICSFINDQYLTVVYRHAITRYKITFKWVINMTCMWDASFCKSVICLHGIYKWINKRYILLVR